MLLFPATLLATSRSDRVRPQHFDAVFLEQLIHWKIDSLRVSSGLHKLESNRALTLAARHHATYLLEENLMSHHEKSLRMRTPALRAEHYGFYNPWVGENVAQSYISFAPADTAGTWVRGDTYEDVASDLVDLWVHSPGHRSNFLHADYYTSGVAVAVNDISGKIYAVQVFGGRDPR